MRVDIGRRQANPLNESESAHCSQFRVGGVSVTLKGKCGADVTLVPNLLPFRADTDFSDISISVAWTGKLPPAPGRRLFDSGSVWRLFECEEGFQFDFSTPVLGDLPYKRLIVDEQVRRAQLLLSRECFENRNAAFPLEYPLDEVLITHRLAHERAIELHGCGIIGPNGASNLFVGHSGAGKSTTARLWSAREGVEVLSDDRIIVREVLDRRGVDAMKTPRESVVTGELQQVLRLRDCSASRTNHSAQDDKAKLSSGGMRMYGTPWHGEAAFASPASAPLARILFLEHGRGNILTRLSPSHAVAELFARSFVPFHRHEYVSSALEFLQHVADTVPCYRYSFEPDERAVERILGFRD
jgi:hypothetical protein